MWVLVTLPKSSRPSVFLPILHPPPRLHSSVSLTEEEATPVEEDLVVGLAECESSIYMKVHSHRSTFISTQRLNLTMLRAWNYKGIWVSRVRGPILQVFFPDEKVK
ncbi:hypothetical protein LIER_37013 [Lithospermum erythrorhizon]|uniref:Uncharacterized protein n=1 Tax=Lithospermum erythrorhizon TaxID=34254 RepID=A0AAV3PDY2_LITER